MYNRKTTPKNEKPTTELFMDAILERKACQRHDASVGDPCWGITQSDGLGRGAVCNGRAKAAGFNNPIRPESLRLHRQSKKK